MKIKFDGKRYIYDANAHTFYTHIEGNNVFYLTLHQLLIDVMVEEIYLLGKPSDIYNTLSNFIEDDIKESIKNIKHDSINEIVNDLKVLKELVNGSIQINSSNIKLYNAFSLLQYDINYLISKKNLNKFKKENKPFDYDKESIDFYMSINGQTEDRFYLSMKALISDLKAIIILESKINDENYILNEDEIKKYSKYLKDGSFNESILSFNDLFISIVQVYPEKYIDSWKDLSLLYGNTNNKIKNLFINQAKQIFKGQ